MTTQKSAQKSPVEAVQTLYQALEPYDESTRERILASVLSLLGMRAPDRTSSVASDFPREPKTQPVEVESSTSRPISPMELIQQKQPATNSQRIALFAYYREKVEGRARFSRGDLKAYFAKAKQPIPANYDRDFSEAVKQGWIYEDAAESYLTSKGLEAVEAGFGGKGLPQGRGAPAAHGGSSKKTVAKSKRPQK